ncbi:pyridoxamine 5'-phosphate oxidase family protein [Guptibacillus algicola]|uniref:pyridoxamine 5'-phosphate oxidase family protein n=1 Tax=Guptibacillus algicola TaxID=225844 RepID=UPI001CD2F313|nr:pyridoxamine 5'-phosphate oxidase family protein [Alkalihalobacillus algicola]MCA0988505.1 pyridoxamine 5'-phosphate oxidase family protein [Alkalihalobacillus algicola]
MKIISGNRSFDLDEFMKKPLFAHLSTMADEGPRESPVWFYWEDQCIWIIGTPPSDTFPKRIEENSKCAIGIVDFDRRTGKVLHAGFRGSATVEKFDKGIATRLLTRYLGPNEEEWSPNFQGLGDSNVLIKFVPETVVVRDQSYAPSGE